MTRIQMPPIGIGGRHSDVCLPFTDQLYIDFKDDGFLAASAQGIFDPKIPAFPGEFHSKTPPTVPAGPWKPLLNNTSVDLYFLDVDEVELYTVTISIRSNCS